MACRNPALHGYKHRPAQRRKVYERDRYSRLGGRLLAHARAGLLHESGLKASRHGVATIEMLRSVDLVHYR